MTRERAYSIRRASFESSSTRSTVTVLLSDCFISQSLLRLLPVELEDTVSGISHPVQTILLLQRNHLPHEQNQPGLAVAEQEEEGMVDGQRQRRRRR